MGRARARLLGECIIALPAAGFLVRMFLIQHDCGHGSFFPADALPMTGSGRVLGIADLDALRFLGGAPMPAIMPARAIWIVVGSARSCTLTVRRVPGADSLPAVRDTGSIAIRWSCSAWPPPICPSCSDSFPAGLCARSQAWLSVMANIVAIALVIVAVMAVVGCRPVPGHPAADDVAGVHNRRLAFLRTASVRGHVLGCRTRPWTHA